MSGSGLEESDYNLQCGCATVFVTLAVAFMWVAQVYLKDSREQRLKQNTDAEIEIQLRDAQIKQDTKILKCE